MSAIIRETEHLATRSGDADDSLVRTFSQLDNVLQKSRYPKAQRYDTLLRLLVLKIHDELHGQHAAGLKRYSLEEAVTGSLLRRRMADACTRYAAVLPSMAPTPIDCSDETLCELWRSLDSLDILTATPSMMQNFFMYFTRELSKVDLAQYFTPYDLVDFIVTILNPTREDRVIDPACGTSDFLIAAQRIATAKHATAGGVPQLFGSDVSDAAVDLSKLNLFLNGCMGAVVNQSDSLENFEAHEGKFTLALCNPPFGGRLIERRRHVLDQFELAVGVKGQEIGLLFVELCLRLVVPRGRAGIVVPNGYLGNRGPRYMAFRRWLFRHARIAAVIGFPRFAFRRSGADVSASILVCERRPRPLRDVSDVENHPIYFDLVDSVGWNLEAKYGRRTYKRNQQDGSVLRDSRGNPIPDSDFDRVLSDLYQSSVPGAFPWLLSRTNTPSRVIR